MVPVVSLVPLVPLLPSVTLTPPDGDDVASPLVDEPLVPPLVSEVAEVEPLADSLALPDALVASLSLALAPDEALVDWVALARGQVTVRNASALTRYAANPV